MRSQDTVSAWPIYVTHFGRAFGFRGIITDSAQRSERLKMSILDELMPVSDEKAFMTLLRFCDLPELTGARGDPVYWGSTEDNKLLARGLFFAGMCSVIEAHRGRIGLLGWDGCLFGRYELESACMVSPDDDNNDPALRAVHNLQDVVGCVGDATSEIFQMQTKANCQAAGKDATRALADIFHGRYGWSCDDLGIRVDQLLSYLPLPVEVGEMLNNMRKLVGKDPNDE